MKRLRKPTSIEIAAIIFLGGSIASGYFPHAKPFVIGIGLSACLLYLVLAVKARR